MSTNSVNNYFSSDGVQWSDNGFRYGILADLSAINMRDTVMNRMGGILDSVIYLENCTFAISQVQATHNAPSGSVFQFQYSQGSVSDGYYRANYADNGSVFTQSGGNLTIFNSTVIPMLSRIAEFCFTLPTFGTLV